MYVLCSKLYWVDSKDKKLESASLDGRSNRGSVSLVTVVGTGHVYGLVIQGDSAYISCWKITASIVKVQPLSGSPQVYKSGLSTGAMFSNVYISATAQPSGLTILQGRINTTLGLMLLPRQGPIFFSAFKTDQDPCDATTIY